MVKDKYKTIDELIEGKCKSTGKDVSTARYILPEPFDRVLRILKSKDNKPSKYDLKIISNASDILNSSKFLNPKYIKQLNGILEFYKNRKE